MSEFTKAILLSLAGNLGLLLGVLLALLLISVYLRWERWRADRKFEREVLERWHRFFGGRMP